MKLIIKRGDIYYADLSPVIGSEQGGVRPVLIRFSLRLDSKLISSINQFLANIIFST